nr:hypothetical protein [uncultured archaeon]AQS34158.1 hypothetical protein [uncultured archaeon]
MSRTKIKSHLRKKTKPELKETIALALKNPAWESTAKILAGPTRKQSSLNLFEIEKKVSQGDTILIPGKILSKGELTKQIDIVALSISKEAKEKLAKSKSKFRTIKEEIQKNKKMEGVKVLR